MNAYPQIAINKAPIKSADLRTKGLPLYIIAEREHNYYDNRWNTPTKTALEMVCPIVATNRPTLADKRSSLREWVAEKFSAKSQEEQERITHCIMMKKYGKDIYE